MQHLDNVIGGQHVPAFANGRLENLDPATNTPISLIARSGEPDANAAVEAALRAQPIWGAAGPSERAAVLEAAASLIENRLEVFAHAEARDTGKPIATARRIDIPRAVANFRFFASALRQMETTFTQMDDAINYTLRQPLGPVACITPWNLPLYLLTWKVAPALAMGNTIVAKPSEMTPTTATMLADVLAEAGLPAGAFNVIHGLGPEAGQPLVAHPGIKAVSFTGGTATGALVAQTAAAQFKKLSLELGGKNPTIVFDDADFDKAVAGAVRSGFTNTGQVCLCGSRLLVQKGIYDRFVEAYVQRVAAMKQGDPKDPSTQLGSVISQGHRDKVESYIQLAREEGGTILLGGGRPELPHPYSNGAFVQPTIVGGLSPTCRTATEEIFGPVVTVHPFSDLDDAIEIANGVEYGLAASVWTTNLQTAHETAARIESGMVWVNCWLHRDLRVPFGGVKNSGVGREGGANSLRFYSQDKNVCVMLS